MHTGHDRINPVSLVDGTALQDAPSVGKTNEAVVEARKDSHIHLNTVQHATQQNHHSSLAKRPIAMHFHIASTNKMLGPDIRALRELPAERDKLRRRARGSACSHHTVRCVGAFEALRSSVVPPETTA